MKIFVPIFRQIIPAKHPEFFAKWMVQVSEDDLRNCVIPHWQKIDTSKDIHEVGRLYKKSIEEICGHKLEFGTLDPFLRRDIITVHAGSGSGDKDCSDLFLKNAFTVGYLTAQNKWNLSYGGGDTGGMGQVAKGYYAGLNECGRAEDQYSIQVIPADFVTSVKSLNGLRPKNEGLCSSTDGALVLPDFMMRRYILDTRCTAAITCAGSIGSLDEWTDIAVAIKTGLGNVRLYTLNPYVEKLGGKFYDPLKNQIANSIKCGLQDPNIFNHFRFMKTPEAVFDDLMTELAKNNETPEEKYQARKQRFNFKTGVPRPVPA